MQNFENTNYAANSSFPFSDSRSIFEWLENGDEINAKSILSSAGYIETLRLCDPAPQELANVKSGQMTFMESIFVLDRLPETMGYDRSIVFFNFNEI